MIFTAVFQVFNTWVSQLHLKGVGAICFTKPDTLPLFLCPNSSFHLLKTVRHRSKL